MGYNTRRKSLSLPSLGIAVPSASRAHRPSAKSTPPYDQQTSAPPLKKVKWSYGDDNIAIASPPAPMAAALPKRMRAEHTPPPSPGDVVGSARKVDTEGINDDIVVGVIEQLEKTGNRPHLIKDLATLLSTTNQSIALSANPAALLSSRLSLYLKRPWTALSPCPLAKELIPVHPRKVFYYLTTQPRMPLPENSDDIIPPTLDQMKRLTPSISNPSVAGDDQELEDRVRSPSPEVDLFSPELDDDDAGMPHSPDEPFSGRSSLNPDGTPDMRATPNRAPSPVLEADERGFTETATAVRARGMSLRDPPPPLPSVEVTHSAMMPDEDETPEQQRSRDLKLAYDLFGPAHVRVQDSKAFAASPMMAPKEHDSANKMSLMILNIDHDMEMSDDCLTIMSPEMIDVDELDSMFTDY
ncbi:hypothetical protein DV737_g4440, partial [Chaetothyriales sp. CBS 132003]